MSEDGSATSDTARRVSSVLGDASEDASSVNGHDPNATRLIFSEDFGEETPTEPGYTRSYMSVALACGYGIIAVACAHQAYVLFRNYYRGQ